MTDPIDPEAARAFVEEYHALCQRHDLHLAYDRFYPAYQIARGVPRFEPYIGEGRYLPRIPAEGDTQ